jgi:hypothetical protein
MITTAEFKRQTAKPFGLEMRKLGFKGSGLVYKKETPEFLIAFYIEGGQWGGGYCSVGLHIHPKQIEKDSSGKLDLKKLPIDRYEFKMGLSEIARDKQWEYSDHEGENLQIIQDILTVVNTKAIPVIQLYCDTPGILDSIEISDIQDFHRNYTKKTGTTIATTDCRFSWAMAIIFEFKNPAKAKIFAEYGLSQCPPGSPFFGRQDFERISKA